jgi:hypothetical protein
LTACLDWLKFRSRFGLLETFFPCHISVGLFVIVVKLFVFEILFWDYFVLCLVLNTWVSERLRLLFSFLFIRLVWTRVLLIILLLSCTSHLFSTSFRLLTHLLIWVLLIYFVAIILIVRLIIILRVILLLSRSRLLLPLLLNYPAHLSWVLWIYFLPIILEFLFLSFHRFLLVAR